MTGPFRNLAETAFGNRISGHRFPRALIDVAVRQILHRLPPANKRIMHVRLRIRLNILRHPALRSSLPAKHDVRPSRIYYQIGASGFDQHPLQRHLGKLTGLLRVTAADVGMNAGEPDLFNLLLIEGLAPEIRLKIATALVQRDGVPDSFNLRISSRIWQDDGIVNPANGAYGIPETEEMQRAKSRKCVLEVVSDSESRARARPLVSNTR